MQSLSKLEAIEYLNLIIEKSNLVMMRNKDVTSYQGNTLESVESELKKPRWEAEKYKSLLRGA